MREFTKITLSASFGLVFSFNLSFAQEPPPGSYENFLNGIEELAKSMLPEKEKLDADKLAVSAEVPAPKDEFEKQAEYEKRVSDFERAKQQKIVNLEQEYRAKTKEPADKIKGGVANKEDLQPSWEGMLKKDAANIDEYAKRKEILTEKISAMKAKISQIGDLLLKLNFTQSEMEAINGHWQWKSLLYLSRLERAGELMQDYIIQERTKVLVTERKSVEMSLGGYNPENEEFEISMNDVQSGSVPFDFSGSVKMPSVQARETNRQTDDFTVYRLNLLSIAKFLKM